MTQLLKSISKIPLAFGGASISGEGGGYGFGDISEADSIELLHGAFDQGLRIFDTAPIYGFGLSEERIGKAFKQMREKVFIVSKSGVTWDSNKRVDMNNDPLVATRMLEQSLRDLKSDYIDLYMIHWPDARVDIRRPLEVLAKAKQQGKIKHIGLCNTNISDLEKAVEIDRIEVVQSEFNFFAHNAARELFPYLKTHNISFMSWGTLDKGILTGRVDELRKFDASDCRSWAPWWKNADNKSKFDAMKKIWPLLDKNQKSGLELALGYNLSFPELSTALCGVRSKTQLSSLFSALDNLPSKELLAELVELAKLNQ
ncbi:MAG: aldo/keto reductase [Bacteriovorax sp.]|jgi:aryl-alcohol dehydrogenase-like predicted oxidoreductase